MVDGTTSTDGARPMDARAAFGAARELIDGAEHDADRTRAEAMLYARRREQEAELLIQKARRVLVAAEERAAVIVETARAQAASGIDQVIDLDELSRIIAPYASVLQSGAAASRLDEMLASAIANAVTDAFPADVSA